MLGDKPGTCAGLISGLSPGRACGVGPGAGDGLYLSSAGIGGSTGCSDWSKPVSHTFIQPEFPGITQRICPEEIMANPVLPGQRAGSFARQEV
jgi:hypothetical protein